MAQVARRAVLLPAPEERLGKTQRILLTVTVPQAKMEAWVPAVLEVQECSAVVPTSLAAAVAAVLWEMEDRAQTEEAPLPPLPMAAMEYAAAVAAVELIPQGLLLLALGAADTAK